MTQAAFEACHDRQAVQTRPLGARVDRARESALACILTALLAILLPAPGGAALELVHIADAGNTFLNSTFLDHPDINGNPDAVLLVTQNWNPSGGLTGVVNPHHVGVAYSASSGRWSIYNEDVAAMPLGAAFNVWLPTANPFITLFVHTATEGTSSTHLAHPGLDGCPKPFFTVTHNRTPGGAPGPMYDHAPIILHDPSDSNWYLSTESAATIPAGTSFNVAGAFCETMPPARSLGIEIAERHVSTMSNTSGSVTGLMGDLRFGDVLFVTNESSAGVVDSRAIGVLYDALTRKVAIFNENEDPMPIGAAFHVLVAPFGVFSDGFESGSTSAWSSTTP